MSKKRARLEKTIQFVQSRYGPEALRRGVRSPSASEFPHIPTSFPALDKALVGIGGIPRGRITELLGTATAGMTTLALKVMANAQAEHNLAAYIDLGQTFDGDYAHRCGINLSPSRFLLVRPPAGREALEITQSLIASRAIGLLVFDAVSHLLADPQAAAMAGLLAQLPPTLAKSSGALIFLTPLVHSGPMLQDNYPAGFNLPYLATVRLLLKKERWIEKQNDIRGYQAQALVLKNKLGAAGRTAKIAITFNGVVRGDAT